MNIALVGGSGFIGTNLLPVLTASGHLCTVLSRDPERSRELRLIPGVRLQRANPYDVQSLTTALAGAALAAALELTARVDEALGCDLSLAALIEGPTLEGLTGYEAVQLFLDQAYAPAVGQGQYILRAVLHTQDVRVCGFAETLDEATRAALVIGRIGEHDVEVEVLELLPRLGRLPR